MSWTHYETVKYVQIPDARLGFVRLFLVTSISIYVIVFEMWKMGGYLEASPIIGAVRFSLQQPTKDNCDPNANNDTCTNAFAPLNEMPYCQQNVSSMTTVVASKDFQNPVSYSGSIFPCQIYEAMNAQIVTDTSMVIATRASTQNQTLICDGTVQNTCPRTYQTRSGEKELDFYIAQSEAFTVLVEHAVTAPKICSHKSSPLNNQKSKDKHRYPCSSESFSYQGRLFIAHNHALCTKEFHRNQNSYAHFHGSKLVDTAPCYIGPNRTASTNQDFFSLDILMQAAGGVSLDDCIANPTSNHSNLSPCQTYREAGATLLLNIVWNDFLPYQGIVEPYYYYVPQLVGQSYKQFVPYYDQYRTSRTLVKVHGIKVVVLLGGDFHHFRFVQFLITLTTALGLLAVTTTVVDSLMLYVVPEKERYQRAKYETTTTTSGVSSETETLQTTTTGNVRTPAPSDHEHQQEESQGDSIPVQGTAAGIERELDHGMGSKESTFYKTFQASEGRPLSDEEGCLNQPLLPRTLED